jgi:hypothetical protein
LPTFKDLGANIDLIGELFAKYRQPADGFDPDHRRPSGLARLTGDLPRAVDPIALATAPRRRSVAANPPTKPRTRTGGTTIFRQMLRTLEHSRNRLQTSEF